MGKSTERAIAIVKRAVDLGARAGRTPRGLAMLPMVVAIRAATAMAKGLAEVDMPPPTGTQRVVLTGLASQLRVLAGGILATDRDTRTIEGAMGDLVASALALVDAALEVAPELDRDRSARREHAALKDRDDGIVVTREEDAKTREP